MDNTMDKKMDPIDAQEGTEEVYYKEMSPAQMVARRFFRSRLSLVGVIMLVALFVFAFAGPPIMHMFGYQWYLGFHCRQGISTQSYCDSPNAKYRFANWRGI